MDITSLIIEAVSGAVGGNVAGAALKEKSLGQSAIPLLELSAVATAGRGYSKKSARPNEGSGRRNATPPTEQ